MATNADAPARFTERGREFTFYREHFEFGDFPAYRSADGRVRFWYAPDMRIVTPNELAELLTREWIQQSERGVRIALGNYAELRALPY